MKTHISMINVGDLFKIGVTRLKSKMQYDPIKYEIVMTNFLDEIVITGITWKELRHLYKRIGVVFDGRKRNDKNIKKDVADKVL